jgi:heme O synthase-like polyprenyltransferase
MLRTSQRPLVLGMNKNYALGLGIGLGLAGIGGIASYNMTSALIGGTIWASYLFIYTRMKQTT